MHRLLSAMLIAALLVTSFATLVSAQDATPTAAPETVAPAATTAPAASASLRARQVTGSLEGGKFAKIWLELQPDSTGASVTLVVDWSTDNPRQDGAGFFVLDSDNFVNVLGGASLLENNVAAGNPFDGSRANQLGVSFNADSPSPYTVVLVNDGASNVSFTLTATNGNLVDSSGQVKDPNAKDGAAAPAATTAPPAAPTTAPVTTTTTTTTTAPTVAPTVAVVAPAAPSGQPTILRAAKVEGELPNQFDQHFIGLEPSERDGTIKLTLTFDPQDNSELARKINFWVLDENGFKAYVGGSRPSEVAIAAGNRVLDGSANSRVASFNANGTQPMTVIIYNNSDVPATYGLIAEGATLVDDSGQTMTAQKLGSTGVTTGTTTTTTVAVTTGTTTTGTTTTGSSATSAAPASATPKIGSSYTIKSGDSISAIARDVYGDLNLYDELCTYNKIANCNTIEVGDVIQLPARDQLGTSATAPAAAAPTPTPTRAPAASAAVTTTQTTTTTTAAPTPTLAPTRAPAVAPTTAVTTTAPVTSTAPVTGTAPVTTTATTTRTTSSTGSTATAASSDLLAVAQKNGNFTILIDLVKAAGLEQTLKGPGPFTLFAPTDAAFKQLGDAAINQLKSSGGEQLRRILLFHVVSNNVTSADLENGMEANTLAGESVRFEIRGSTVKVQDSVISPADVNASNGVIHVVDKVMLPPAQ